MDPPALAGCHANNGKWAASGQLDHALLENMPGLAIESTAAYGVMPEWVEAAAFAWLARQQLAGRPGNIPAVTGATRTVSLGQLFKS